MTGAKLAEIRRELAGDTIEATVIFGRALGRKGSDEVVAQGVRRLETRDKVPGSIARLADIFVNHPTVWKKYSD